MSASMFDTRFFMDPLPIQMRATPLYKRLGKYPIDVQTFPYPIFFLPGQCTSWEHSPLEPVIMHDSDEMAFRNFVVFGNDDGLTFMIRNPPTGFHGTGSPSMSINKDFVDLAPITTDAPEHVVEKVVDSEDTPDV